MSSGASLTPVTTCRDSPELVEPTEVYDIFELWREVFFRGLLDALGYLNEREPRRTSEVYAARSWIHSPDFWEIAELAQLDRKQAHRLGAAVLAKPPVERLDQPRKGGRSMIEEVLCELAGG